MTFAAPAAYDRFMGRYSRRLAPLLADLARVESGQRVLDVGCGPGALTGELVLRVGAGSVSAVDPSAPFVTEVRRRYPGVDAREASAESLPYPDHRFEVTLAQLVVHFMSDPVRGLGEMRRVTRPGGVVAACVWDHGGGRGPLSEFWRTARELDPAAADESNRPGVRQGQLVSLFIAAGLDQVEEAILTVSVEMSGFDEWWEPFTLGVGPPGAYVATLDETARERLMTALSERMPSGPFVHTVSAWSARGIA